MIDSVTQSLLTMLNAGDWKFGDGMVPDDVPVGHPWGILETIPGGNYYESFGVQLSMATLAFQIKYVGLTGAQVRRLQEETHERIATNYHSVTGCMGIRLSPGGIVTDDQRSFMAVDTLYLEVTSV